MDQNESITMTTTPMLAFDERQCAHALNMSVAWLRKDRRGKRLIPFYRLGGRILYSPVRVQAALDALEEGGRQPRRASKVNA